MVVSFNRGARGQNALRQILAPVVKEIMDDKSLNIKTDPVDIYKSWVNQMESQTGEARYIAMTPFSVLHFPLSLSLSQQLTFDLQANNCSNSFSLETSLLNCGPGHMFIYLAGVY